MSRVGRVDSKYRRCVWAWLLHRQINRMLMNLFSMSVHWYSWWEDTVDWGKAQDALSCGLWGLA